MWLKTSLLTGTIKYIRMILLLSCVFYKIVYIVYCTFISFFLLYKLYMLYTFFAVVLF